MNKQKKYLQGFWILCIVLFFRLLMIGLVYFSVRHFAASGGYIDVSKIKIIAVHDIVILSVLLVQATTYWFLRYRIINKLWVKLHIWPVFFAVVILPLFITLFLIIAPKYLGKDDFSQLRILVSNTRYYLFWALSIFGHAFFIVTVVTIFKSKPGFTAAASSGDLLEEFSS